jgi:hypothetical protein
MKNKFKISFLLVILLSLSSCWMRNYKTAAVSGGVTGTLVGAGVGAATGAIISGGDVGASALLGAGVGLPVGVAAGLAYKHYVYEKPVRENNKLIDDNYETILRRKREIRDTREKMLNESYLVKPNPALRDKIYLGPTLGM